MRKSFYFYFFFSGLAGLIYEVLWVRLFVLVMGGTVYSFTTVLVGFMAGLTLGGWLGGKYADRMVQSPLLVYGVLEGLIGLYCLLIPLLISGLNPVFNLLYPFLQDHNSAGLVVRFLASGVILIVPTTMMGATLPILVRYSYGSADEFGRTTARLYAVNTFGAVAGSFVSGMVLIPALGQRATLYAAAGLNLAIMVSIIWFWRVRPADFRPLKEKFEPLDQETGLGLKPALLLGLYALSGAAAMVYQVAWTRALILSLGTTLYVLSLILTAYITGLAIGAAVIAPLVDRIKRLWLGAGIFEILIGVSAWAVVPLFARLPLWMGLAQRPPSYYAWLGIEFLAGTALILVPTFLMGALLPVTVRLYKSLRGGVGSAVGQVYAWNTVGAIAGSFLCGFLLINWLGLRNTLILASLASLAIGAALVFCEKKALIAKLALPAAAAACAAGFLYFMPGWSPEIIGSGPYYYHENFAESRLTVSSLERMLKTQGKLLFHKEGVEATVDVMEINEDNTIGLRINGKSDASTGGDMPTQVAVGHLPLLFHPAAKSAALLGLASGVTLGSMLTHPLEKITCVEISPEVVAASEFFKAYNRRPLEDSRTRLIINDGRYHFAHTRDKYDVIVSEPSNPWVGGEGLLFTRDFFLQARDRLNPGGIMVTWIGIYDLNLEAVKMIARTFLDVFPESILWEAITGGDYLIVGFTGPAQIDYSLLKSRLEEPAVKDDLSRVRLARPERIISRFLMGPEELREFAGSGPLHSDDRRQIELTVPRQGHGQNYRQRVLPTMKEIYRYKARPERRLSFKNEADRADLPSINFHYDKRDLAMYAFLSLAEESDVAGALRELEQAIAYDPEEMFAREILWGYYTDQGKRALAQGKVAEGMANYVKAWELKPRGSAIPTLAGYYFMGAGDLDRAAQWADKALAASPVDSLAWMLRGRVEMQNGRPDLALNSFARALANFDRVKTTLDSSPLFKSFSEANPMDPKADLFFDMGQACRRLGRYPEALTYYTQATAVNPDYLSAWAESGILFLQLGQYQAALKRFEKVLSLRPDDPQARLLYAQALARIPEQKQQAISELEKILGMVPKEWPQRAAAEKELSRLLTEP